MIRPGLFGKQVAADSRRMDFDFGNEQLLFLNKKIDFLFMGDSITQLWDIPAYAGSGFTIVNRAIGGDTSCYLNKRWDADCTQLHPKRCILMIGTNDISESDQNLWWKLPGKPVDEVFGSYRQNIEDIMEKCKGAGIPLALCSIPPSDIAPPFDKELRFSLTSRMNVYLCQTASKNGLDYLDYFPALVQTDGKTIRPEYSRDGIHPNARGYQVMADILVPWLQTL